MNYSSRTRDDRQDRHCPPKQDSLLSEAWRFYPDTFAYRVSGGRWLPYAWLQYLSKRLTPYLINGGGRFVVSAPPQHGKSEFISHYVPAWFLNSFPERKVILGSYSSDYATKWGAKVNETLRFNPLAQVPLSPIMRGKRRFATTEGGQMISVGIGGTATGEGAHLFVIDDPIKNFEEANSPTIRERHYNWYLSVARTRLQPTSTVILLMTRWHDDDLAGRLINDGFEYINFEAICETPKLDPLGRSVGQALCPQRYDEAALRAAQEDLGGLLWSAMYQGRPVSVGGNIIKSDWIRYYDQSPEHLDEIGLFADLNYKRGEETDFAVFEAWGRRGPDIYLLGQIRDRMDFPEQLRAFERMIELYPNAFHKEIEDKANGSALISVARETIPGLVANNPKTEKEARLASVAPIYRSGNVWYPNPDRYPWVRVNIEEIVRFPKAKHDDTVDVASMAVAHLGRLGNALKRLEALTRR